MYKRILVPVDGSAPSRQAIATALTLAKEIRAKVRILNVADVLPPPALDAPASIDVDAYRGAMIAAGRAILEDATGRARRARIAVETRLVETVGRDVSGTISDEARRWRADLIVVGSHGRSGLARVFLGSVAEGVARHAPCAVLLVRAAAARRRR